MRDGRLKTQRGGNNAECRMMNDELESQHRNLVGESLGDFAIERKIPLSPPFSKGEAALNPPLPKGDAEGLKNVMDC